MPKLPIISAKKLITILEEKGFLIVSQRGSHIKLKRNGETIVVPNHKEIRKGTLKNILRMLNMSVNELLRLP